MSEKLTKESPLYSEFKSPKNVPEARNSRMTCTSTPICGSDKKMDSYTNFPVTSENSSLRNFPCNIDNDSGYISHNQESNCDSIIQDVPDRKIPRNLQADRHVFMNEDALLEKPELCANLSTEIDKEDYEETRRLFNSFTDNDSVVSSSFVSEKTELSGFELSGFSSDSTQSSIVIPYAEPLKIVFPNESSNSRLRQDSSSFSDLVSVESSQSSSVISQNSDLYYSQKDQKIINDKTEVDGACKDDIINKENDDQQVSLEDFENKENFNFSKINAASTSTQDKTEIEDLNNACKNGVINNDTGDQQSSLIDSENKENFICNKNVTQFSAQMKIITDKTEIENLNNACSKDNGDQQALPQGLRNKENSNIQIIQNIIITRTPTKMKIPVKSFEPSPDLFDDESDHRRLEIAPVQHKPAAEQYVLKQDVKLIREFQASLNGCIPPTSVTTINITAEEILTKLESNKEYFWNVDPQSGDGLADAAGENAARKSLLLNRTDVDVDEPFPAVLKSRFHGLHHNRSKLSEDLELLCTKYAQRCVGAETQSTCTVFKVKSVSPPRGRIGTHRFNNKSPGRRLSHLARRRLTFNCANIQSSNSSFVANRTRQILIDAKKLELLSRKKSPKFSPREKSPKKTRSPSSSAKKKLAMRFRMVSGEIEGSIPSTSAASAAAKTKKNLFQDMNLGNDAYSILPGTSAFSRERSLLGFNGSNLKRKRTDCDDIPEGKLFKPEMKPSKTEMRSALLNINNNNSENKSSQINSTELYKKKLHFVVYEALRSQNISSAHAQFKSFASTLARVVRRFISPNSSPSENNSEKMMKVARLNVFQVIKGKNVDEIIDEYMKNKQKLGKSQMSGPLKENTSRREELNSSLSNNGNKENILRESNSNVKNKSLPLLKNKFESNSRLDRIRKVINFGEDNR